MTNTDGIDWSQPTRRDDLTLEVDGIVYDQRIHDRMSTSGTGPLSPYTIPAIDPDECLCGTGFPCLVHPLGDCLCGKSDGDIELPRLDVCCPVHDR